MIYVEMMGIVSV